MSLTFCVIIPTNPANRFKIFTSLMKKAKTSESILDITPFEHEKYTLNALNTK